jgi:type II secretory pathway component GspD/PulD (secretin)
MAMKQPYATGRRWCCRVLVSLLIALGTWTSAWPLRPLDTGTGVVVHNGLLSADLRETPVREVLAAIGQQAGLRVYVDASANGMVNAQFTDLPLDQGLRRLLRAASVSYTLLYARGPAETVVLQEVRVFGEARGGGPTRDDRVPRDRAQRTAALVTPLPQEEQAELEPTEPEQEAEPEPAESEQEIDASQN